MEAEHAARLEIGDRQSRLSERARSIVLSTWTLGALVFVLTWKGGIVEPTTPNLDGSLHAGLNIAAVGGLDFGSDIVFTYGPLGFLKAYVVFYEWPARLAVLYGVALHLALSISLVWAIRRNFGPAVAVVGALFLAAIARGDESAVGIRVDASVVILALIWCVAVLGRDAPDWARKIVVYGGGPFAAVEILAKVNTGFVVLAMVAITVLALEHQRRRNLAIVATGFLATAAVLWFAAGQGIDDVYAYLSRSLEVASGYSSGAWLEWGTRDYDYVIAPLVVAAAGAVTWISTAGLGWQRQGAIVAIVAIVAFTAAKGGFVSHDPYHMATFYGTMLGVVVAMPLPRRNLTRIAVFAVTVGAIAASYTTALTGYPLGNPLENARAGVETVARLVDGERLRSVIEDNRAILVEGYDLDPKSLELLEGHTVHVHPSEAAAAWAYELDWRPLPVFQPYVAWTESLDRQNADAIASADGPERILRQNLSPLGRYPAFESPAAMLAMLCNFRAARTTPQWQVLERVENRCGEPEPIGTGEGTYGEPIAIPPAQPGTVVFGRVEGVEDVGIEQNLRRLLVRSQGRQVSFTGEPPYTFNTGTAKDGLVLAASPEVEFQEPFALAPDSDQVTFLLDGAPANHPITVKFYAIEVEP